MQEERDISRSVASLNRSQLLLETDSNKGIARSRSMNLLYLRR